MRYCRLGKTELEVSVVGVGTWQYGGEWGKTFRQDEVNAILARAYDLGINLIDTAECYGDHLSEELIGRAIEGTRDQWILATKFGHKFHRPFERDTLYDPQQVLEQLQGSLRALRTDYIDLYQFHSGNDEQLATPGLWAMLAEQVKKGTVRHLGLSIGNNDNLAQVEKSPELNVQAIQVVYNRLNKKSEPRVLPACMELDLGVLARVPLASGYLSGRYTTESVFAETDIRGRGQEEWRLDALRQAQVIKQTEVPAGVPMAEWALAWCLKHPAVTCVIPGCKSVEQVESNAAAADLDVLRDDIPGVGAGKLDPSV